MIPGGSSSGCGLNSKRSVFESAQKVLQLTGAPAPYDERIVFVPYAQAYEAGFEDMPRRAPDIRKIKQFVGWKPQVALEGTLREVIGFYQM